MVGEARVSLSLCKRLTPLEEECVYRREGRVDEILLAAGVASARFWQEEIRPDGERRIQFSRFSINAERFVTLSDEEFVEELYCYAHSPRVR